MTLKKYLFAACIAVAAVSITADTSFARLFGRHGGSYGSWGGGSYGGSWGGGYGSWGGGSWGGGSWGGGYSGGSCGSHGGGYSNYGSYRGYYGTYGYDNSGYYASSRVVRSATTIVAAKPAVKTSLTLRVPAEAKVTLAGIATKQTGDVRQFATSNLAAGQNWEGYKVVVEVDRDGQTLREERDIVLTGGQAQELTINFDSTEQVAQLTR